MSDARLLEFFQKYLNEERGDPNLDPVVLKCGDIIFDRVRERTADRMLSQDERQAVDQLLQFLINFRARRTKRTPPPLVNYAQHQLSASWTKRRPRN
jgi:hypothetical protein